MTKEDKYVRERVTVSIDKEVLDRLNEIKKYPFWRGNLSRVTDLAFETFLEEDFAKTAKCLKCGKEDKRNNHIDWAIIDLIKGVGICQKCLDEWKVKWSAEDMELIWCKGTHQITLEPGDKLILKTENCKYPQQREINIDEKGIMGVRNEK